MTRRARLAAEAKVNLGLRITARDDAGYHQLETVFARIALADTVELTLTASGRTLECEGPSPGPAASNLALRAAEAFLAATRWSTGVHIALTKRIPMGGGLGGGSADAGAVLRLLNALAPEPLSPEALATVAFGLGADVPFLTTTLPLALAWGRGERLLALPPLPPRALLLGLPPFGVETRAAFGWAAEARRGRAPTAPASLRLEDLATWEGLRDWSTNDLEAPVLARHPAVGELLDRLRGAGASIARMSGSGSTVFGVFETPPATLTGPEGTRWVPSRLVTHVAAVERLD